MKILNFFTHTKILEKVVVQTFKVECDVCERVHMSLHQAVIGSVDEQRNMLVSPGLGSRTSLEFLADKLPKGLKKTVLKYYIKQYSSH